jgi:hypothetical protein
LPTALWIHIITWCLKTPAAGCLIRAGIVEKGEDYIWSSIKYYFSSNDAEIVDVAFIDELFGSREELISALRSNVNQELTVTETKYGDILGSESFMESALKKYNRRGRPTGQSSGARRIDERNFEPVEKVVWEFERLVGTEIEKVDTKTLEGKRLRGELLVHQ